MYKDELEEYFIIFFQLVVCAGFVFCHFTHQDICQNPLQIILVLKKLVINIKKR